MCAICRLQTTGELVFFFIQFECLETYQFLGSGMFTQEVSEHNFNSRSFQSRHLAGDPFVIGLSSVGKWFPYASVASQASAASPPLG